MRGAKQLMSSARTGTGSDTWCTPLNVLERVRRVGPIDLDPCWNEDAATEPAYRYSQVDGEECDGLGAKWLASPNTVVYVNPPYSDIRSWLAKCRDEWKAGRNDCTIALVPARTDTRAWHTAEPSSICFWRGRLTFLGATAPAPFPSALLCWALGDMRDRFCAAFADAGMIVYL